MNALILQESSRGISTYTTESSLLRNRIIFFHEEVTPESSNQLITYLLHLDAEAPGEEITLCIASPGGDVVSGLAVYDVMQMIKSPIRTVATGLAASMGAVLFMGGKKRELTAHSRVMIHDPLLSGSGGIKRALELEKEAAQLMETRSILAEIIAKRSGHSIEEVLEKTREDCYMDAKQAIEFGIATGICTNILNN